jgi:hypothetical protein
LQVGQIPSLSSLEATLVLLDISGNPGLDGGPLWPWLAELAQLKVLKLGNTNRTGDIAAVQLPVSLSSLDLSNNGFIPAPLPLHFQNLTLLVEVALANTSIYGPMNASRCALEMASGTSCFGQCSTEYTGMFADTLITPLSFGLTSLVCWQS